MNINIKKINLTDIFLFYNLTFLIIEKTRLLGPTSYLVLLIINSYIVILFLLVQFKNSSKKIHKFNIPIYIFVFYCTISVFWSEYTFESLYAVMKLIYPILVILLSFINKKDSLIIIKNSLNFVILINILYIILFPENAIYKTGEWQGIYLAKNTFASFIVLTFLFNAFYYLRNRTKKGVHIFWSIILFILALKAQSIAALSLIALFLMMNIYLYFVNKIKNSNLKLSFIFISVGGFVVFYYFFDKYIPLIFEYFGKDVYELTGRDIIWSTVINYSLESPYFGKGYGGVWAENGYLNTLIFQYMDGFNVYSAHNTFLDIFINVGLIGLGLFLIIILIFLYSALQAFIKMKQFVYLTIFIVLIVQNFTETRIVLYTPIYWYYFVYFYIEVKMKLSEENPNKEKGKFLCDQKNHLKI